MNCLVSILLGGALVLLGYVWWRSMHWRRRGVVGPSGLPLAGNMLDFLLGRKHYGEVYADIYRKFKSLPYVGVYQVGNVPAILVCSQEMVKEVLIRSFAHFQDNALLVTAERDPLVNCNPFVAQGDRWRQMRNDIGPLFTPNKNRVSFPHVKAVCVKLESFLERGLNRDCFEAKDLFSKFTLDVVGSAAFGLDAQTFTNDNSDFCQLVDHLFLPHSFSLLNTIALLYSPIIHTLINFRYVPSDVQNWLRSIIGKVLDQRLPPVAAGEANGGNSRRPSNSVDFIQWLIEAKQKSGEPVDRNTIVGHCSTFLLEGFETSSSLMAFAMYLYSVNPDVQQRVQREVDDVLARHDGQLDYDALQEMTYLEATLYETMRLYPAMFALIRKCTKPFELPPQRPNARAVVVPEGTAFVIPVYGIHRDPSIFEEPSEFRAERFINDADNDRQSMTCQFLAFGEGPRLCLGMRFGLMQSKAGLATLLAKYSVELADKMDAPLRTSPTTFLIASRDGIWLKLKDRPTHCQ